MQIKRQERARSKRREKIRTSQTLFIMQGIIACLYVILSYMYVTQNGNVLLLKTINYDINLYIFTFNLPLEVTGVARGKNKWEEDGGSKNRENYNYWMVIKWQDCCTKWLIGYGRQMFQVFNVNKDGATSSDVEQEIKWSFLKDHKLSYGRLGNWVLNLFLFFAHHFVSHYI